MHLQLEKRKLSAREFKELVTSRARRVKAKADDMQTKPLSAHSLGDSLQQQMSTCDPQDERETISFLNLKSTDFEVCEVQHRDSKGDNETESEHSKCLICSYGGKVLCCAGKGCRRNFHLHCVKPPLRCFPLGTWYCILCVKKKMVLGVHAVSEGVESILGSRDIDSDNEVTHMRQQIQKEYLVKYKGLAHIHNRWIPERDLIVEASTILAKFKKYNKKTSWKTDWSMPHRLLDKRLLLLPSASETNSPGHNDNGSVCHYEWLVKWTGLDYDQATWELETTSCLISPKTLKMISDYEYHHRKANLEVHPSVQDNYKGSQTTFPELLTSPVECTAQVHISNFIYVNKLLQYWSTSENAVAIDNQEWILKMVLLVSSFSSHTRHPFLIITSRAALSHWEDEFSRCAPSINVVVYKGNDDVRAFIRTLEFYNEQGAIMFQVLISHCDTVVQDIKILKSICWEVIIIDASQRFSVLKNLRYIKMLATSKKLLLFRQVEDKRSSYRKFLSLLDTEYKETNCDSPESGSDTEDIKLKERFKKFVAYECKSSSVSKFVEYWVPVRLSDLQIEQYRACLTSNSHLLCSSSKSDSSSSLHDILLATRKCCDHPYLVDWTLGKSMVEGIPVDDQLDAEIELSGKLQLLSRTLFEIRKQGLRALILFQSLPASGDISVGDILDDFIHQKFGVDSHARICVNVSPPMRRSILNKFNNKESGRFVLLMETRACVPSIKLSFIDTVFLFDSDCDPMNDLRALQKITIESKFEEMKVFRLYSSFTIEEKVLILAKSGLPVESKVKRIKQTSCHELLAWGASYLLSECNNNSQFSKVVFGDVFSELLKLLPGSCDNVTDSANCTRILRVEPDAGVYPRNISLPAELEMQLMEDSSVLAGLIEKGQTSLFWKKLLEGMHRRRKCFSNPSRRVRNQQPLSSSVKLSAGNLPQPFSDELGSNITTAESTNNQKDFGSNNPLHIEMNKIQKEREQTTKLHEDLKLLLKSEFEKEMVEIRKKYDLLFQNAELENAEKQKELDGRYAIVKANMLLADFMIEKANADYTVNPSTQEMRPPTTNREHVILDHHHQSSETAQTNGLQFLQVPLQAGGQNPSSCTSFTGNLQAGCEIRAPASHLRHLLRPTPVMLRSEKCVGN